MPNPTLIFHARIDAQGFLFAEGEMTRGEFLDAVGDAAVQLVVGLRYGSSFTQACREADAQATKQQQQQRPAIKEFRVAASTIEAAEYLVREGDAKRLRTWLDEHPLTEARAISKHIRKYRDKRRGQQCPTTK